MIRVERRRLKTRTVMVIGVATWLGLSAFFFGLSVKIADSQSGWVVEHGGAIIWSTLGVVLLVGVAAAVRDRRLGITLILALAAAFLCFVAINVYIYSHLE